MSSARNRALRAGFVIDRLSINGSLGGTENQLRLVLRELDRARIEPTLICLRDAEAVQRERLNCEIRNLDVDKVRPPEGIRGVYRLRSLARRLNLHLLAPLTPDSAAIGAAAGKLAGIPVIGARRNIGHWFTPRTLRWTKLVNRWTDGFIANSEAAKRAAVEIEGLAPERIRVIYNAVDSSRFRPLEARDPAAPLVIGCVANLRDVKGHDTLLRAFAAARARLPGARLELIGDGPRRAELEALTAELGLGDSVRFLGTRRDTPELAPRFDLGVLPSDAESFSNTILEYMACGLPTVATAVGGVGEAIDSTVGRLVPAKNPAAMAAALIELGTDPALRRELGARARAVVAARFAVGPIIEQWQATLEGWVGR